jgi:uncharacterized BrkB/YihY/UPF0761 family membrane protein
VNSADGDEGRAPGAEAAPRLAAARARFEGSWAQELAGRLKVVDFGNSVVLFGAALLISVLPPSLLWFGLAVFSSVYFSSAVTSENKLFGTIGVVFILLTWFTAVGAVIVLGAAGGAVWQHRRERRRESPGST